MLGWVPSSQSLDSKILWDILLFRMECQPVLSIPQRDIKAWDLKWAFSFLRSDSPKIPDTIIQWQIVLGGNKRNIDEGERKWHRKGKVAHLGHFTQPATLTSNWNLVLLGLLGKDGKDMAQISPSRVAREQACIRRVLSVIHRRLLPGGVNSSSLFAHHLSG